MGLFDRFKKNAPQISDNNISQSEISENEIESLYVESMKALNQAMTLEDKEKAVELANKNHKKMIELGMDRENDMLTTLEAEAEQAKKEANKAFGKAEESAQYIEDKMHRLDNAPAARNVRAIASNEARRTAQEMFNRQYSNIINVQTSLINGEYDNEFYKKLSTTDKKILLLPFLLEKKALCGLTKSEEDMLEIMKLLASLSGYKGYKIGYAEAVENLHAIGLIDIRDGACFMQTFDSNVQEGVNRQSIANYAEFRNNHMHIENELSNRHSSR